jgi:hypothetical protein
VAGTIVVSDIRSDNDNTITFTSNTGETIFTANLSSGIDGNFLANTGVTAAVYGGASQIPVVTVDEKGRITSAANVSISAGGSSISAGDSNVAVVDSGTGRVEMNVDGSTRAIFNEYGLGLGPNVPSSGIGILFPASQSASSDANTLDDYEEGTWTPSDQSGAGLTLTNAQGKYTKIGRQVTAWGWVEYPSTANGTNNQIGGLPFNIANSNPDRGGGMIGYKTDSTVVTLRGENNGTFFQFKDSTGGNITNATLSTDVFFFAITYQEA